MMKKLSFIKKSNGNHWVGDGFPVRGIFSYADIAQEMSPFLLMDYAGPAYFPPTTNKLGVGQHPHRGFETVTIVYDGGVSHRDSSGAGGTIEPGDVQWMTAASGIIHEEYHSPAFAQSGGAFEMVQLWVNLPAKDKMTSPSYQGITNAEIPEASLPDDAGIARIIAGSYEHTTGPASTFTPMNVWDLRLKANHHVSFQLPEGHTTALFILKGKVKIEDKHLVHEAELAVMEREGDVFSFSVEEETTALLLNGAPLNEPVVGHGPFVMNTREEISQAIFDYNNGQFGKIS
ncbi:pirin family protein [Photobacterium sp. 2_MG-2023]|uniref:pirin family protein n=1 Tax=unclassified Photobacterium TaxID=2628852 RepID=UPI001C47E705|nr:MULTISPECIES: pirin family protein [unclassified Photobacterium]MBV7261335.1 pirin family protein [Photobacterium sp. WH24]MDO6581056.1 pirin family protein [Photobacterium sp. 2_MG-2023]